MAASARETAPRGRTGEWREATAGLLGSGLGLDVRYLPISLQIWFHCTVCTAMVENVNKVSMDCRLGSTLSCLVGDKAKFPNPQVFCHHNNSFSFSLAKLHGPDQKALLGGRQVANLGVQLFSATRQDKVGPSITSSIQSNKT